MLATTTSSSTRSAPTRRASCASTRARSCRGSARRRRWAHDDPRTLATALALNRVAFGVGYLIAPERTGTGWIGGAARDDATKVFTRALGARDLALGLGALR